MANENEKNDLPAHRRGRPLLGADEKKTAATFRLSPVAHNLITGLVGDMGISKAGVVETAVRDLAKVRGVKPTIETEEKTV